MIPTRYRLGTDEPRDLTCRGLGAPLVGPAGPLVIVVLRGHDIEVIHGQGVPYPCLKQRSKPVASGQQGSAPLSLDPPMDRGVAGEFQRGGGAAAWA
jgi:hypothetical protein